MYLKFITLHFFKHTPEDVYTDVERVCDFFFFSHEGCTVKLSPLLREYLEAHNLFCCNLSSAPWTAPPADSCA